LQSEASSGLILKGPRIRKCGIWCTNLFLQFAHVLELGFIGKAKLLKNDCDLPWICESQRWAISLIQICHVLGPEA
jgi:hypothetical protein